MKFVDVRSVCVNINCLLFTKVYCATKHVAVINISFQSIGQSVHYLHIDLMRIVNISTLCVFNYLHFDLYS